MDWLAAGSATSHADISCTTTLRKRRPFVVSSRSAGAPTMRSASSSRLSFWRYGARLGASAEPTPGPGHRAPHVGRSVLHHATGDGRRGRCFEDAKAEHGPLAHHCRSHNLRCRPLCVRLALNADPAMTWSQEHGLLHRGRNLRRPRDRVCMGSSRRDNSSVVPRARTAYAAWIA
jgi:hypothetical protein